jgi:hypothetical protein
MADGLFNEHSLHGLGFWDDKMCGMLHVILLSTATFVD